MQLLGKVERHGNGGDRWRTEPGEVEQWAQGELIDRPWIAHSDVHVENELFEEAVRAA